MEIYGALPHPPAKCHRFPPQQNPFKAGHFPRGKPGIWLTVINFPPPRHGAWVFLLRRCGSTAFLCVCSCVWFGSVVMVVGHTQPKGNMYIAFWRLALLSRWLYFCWFHSPSAGARKIFEPLKDVVWNPVRNFLLVWGCFGFQDFWENLNP